MGEEGLRWSKVTKMADSDVLEGAEGVVASFTERELIRRAGGGDARADNGQSDA